LAEAMRRAAVAGPHEAGGRPPIDEPQRPSAL
jgi:hypothetical protein